ncbi:hypothetical protein WEI85_00505 [Actinomycetes bacterium KLBMP 9797]
MTEPARTPTPSAEHGHLAEINPASDIGQRWWRGWHSWTHRSQGGFDLRNYEVHSISDPTSKSYVEDCARLVNDRSSLPPRRAVGRQSRS